MNDFDDIFNLADEQPSPIKGALLVAKPTIDDVFFQRAVILLISHDADGSMGLVLNDRSDVMLSRVVPDVNVVNDVPLYLGGPVNPDVMFFFHTLGNELIPNSMEIVDGLYFVGDQEALTRYIESGGVLEGKVKFVVGYSGWSSGQLVDEIDNGVWAVLDAHDVPVMMTAGHHEMWQWAVSQFGPRYRMWRHLPINPSEN